MEEDPVDGGGGPALAISARPPPLEIEEISEVVDPPREAVVTLNASFWGTGASEDPGQHSFQVCASRPVGGVSRFYSGAGLAVVVVVVAVMVVVAGVCWVRSQRSSCWAMYPTRSDA